VCRRRDSARFNGNKLKLGTFCSNCSSALALMAADTGLEFLLPVARWIGFGGDSDFQGNTLDAITWAAAMLEATGMASRGGVG
jgi:dimethylsulfone monooxygenase